jgi:Flp pilus assembly protein TadG
MPETKLGAWRRFGRDERGNIAILFAAAAVPLILVMGGAADIARFTRYKTELSNAVDSAALALARRGEDLSEDDATVFVKNYVDGFNVEDSAFKIDDIKVTKTDNGFHVATDATMNTVFLSVAGLVGGSFSQMNMDLAAEVVHSSNRVELALVLDNTGSMNCGATVSSSCTNNWSSPGPSSRIAGLKSAAQKLIDVLMTDEALADDFVKVGVVPFEGAVNIKNASLDYSWLDWNDVAQAKYNGRNFDNYDVDTSNDPCTTTTSGGGRRHGGGGTTTTTCTETTERVGHKWLFDQLHANDSNVSWAGCVEMRAEPYDQTDEAPDSANPDTLFVPFFWPDEPDSDNNNGDYYSNNYLNDDTSSNGSAAQKKTAKYVSSTVSWQSGKKDTSFPYTSGPNYGCPRPLLPLTKDRDSVETAISDMIAYPAMGTYIPTGLAWGWRVLTPGAPFTEGVGPSDEYYAKTVKALVLLTDGENSVTGVSNHNKSIFSAYNYIGLNVDGDYRLGSNDASTAEANLNAKTASLCEKVKAAKIRLYTITFGDIPSAAESLMHDCASIENGERLYYHAPSNSELGSIFYSIGQDLADIHLSM